MVIPNVYFKYNGVEYFDYTLYSEQNFDIGDYSASFVLHRSVKDALKEQTKYLDLNTFPAKGSVLYPVPPCPLCIEDVRRNYTLKKKADSADYNVFPPLNKSIAYRESFSVSGIAIFPSRKAIVTARAKGAWNAVPTENDLRRVASSFLINLDFSDMILLDHRDCNMSFYLYDVKKFGAYKDLLDRKLTKPCVPYKNLDLSTGNELTVDILQAIVIAGKQPKYATDAEKNLLVQLNVLNQFDWRQYKGTIGILVHEIWRNSCIAKEMKNQKSRYPKVIKEIFSVPWKNPTDEKDFALAQQLVGTAMNIGDCRFANAADLIKKMNVTGICLSTFDHLFQNITKITPRQYAKQS